MIYNRLHCHFRNCIGQNFAMNELKTVMARILHRYVVSMVTLIIDHLSYSRTFRINTHQEFDCRLTVICENKCNILILLYRKRRVSFIFLETYFNIISHVWDKLRNILTAVCRMYFVLFVNMHIIFVHRFILEVDPDRKPQQMTALVSRAKHGIHLVLNQR